ncbi:hypothetical protein F511_01873 [Dorcoceras hygrometricum]|uniref:Uncharacterized protein n=1 Tax=Dorcoceras hygrometricum TaxID=472368 RepID=A0A2Z7CVG8_9LAMI|nr:hypothetical protein F511_01873 [Dorcoceras hygrometricum]
MEAEDVVNLFDSFWFYPNTFVKHLNSPAPEAPLALAAQNQEFSLAPTKLSIHPRSRSHDHIILMKRDKSSSAGSSSPYSVLSKPHLETIPSQKEISQEIPRTRATGEMKKPSKGLRKTRKGSSKSLSELEFEELKGFMDLGFVFSEEDKNSNLADIIPGLHRFGEKNDSEVQEETTCGGVVVEEFGGSRARPYLSEAWESLLEKENREINPLSDWKVPVVGNEIVMKDSLKWWAHAVASAVR